MARRGTRDYKTLTSNEIKFLMRNDVGRIRDNERVGADSTELQQLVNSDLAELKRRGDLR